MNSTTTAPATTTRATTTLGTTTLERRASHLRAQASELPSPLALAYRRRASELELQAYLLSAQQLGLAA